MTNLVPVVNDGLLYVNGGVILTLTNTTFQVSPTQARDSTNTFDMEKSSFQIVDFATRGLNGLDTGTIAASSSYDVYMIADPSGYQLPGYIVKLTNPLVLPVLPEGYGLIRRLGYIITNGASQIVQYRMSGNANVKQVQYEAAITFITAGVAAAFTAVDLTTPVMAAPKVSGIPALLAGQTSAGSTFALRPTGNTTATGSTAPWRIAGTAGGSGSQFVISGVNGVPNPSVDYQVSAGNVNVSVNGYLDFV